MATLQKTKIDPTGITRLPQGTTAQRPSPTVGMVRYNTDLKYTEIYDGTTWKPFSNINTSSTINSSNSAVGGYVSQTGGYKIHTFVYDLIYSDNSQTALTDDGSATAYIPMKSFRVTKGGLIDVSFRAYIQSGTYYFAYRILVNGTSVRTGFYNDADKLSGTGNVHVYRDFSERGILVERDDDVTVEMVSSNGSGTPTVGNGQVLYLKNLNVYNYQSTFTPNFTGTVEVLVVAGGGGGSCYNSAGGGGAGGLIYNSAYSVTAGTDYTVTVGKGGKRAFQNQNSGYPATNGENSVFDNLTAIGGGHGGFGVPGRADQNAGVGGSGGGGRASDATVNLGAAGTEGQGNKGGDGGTYTTNYPGGGGGGAGGPGANGVSDTTAGNGGPGIPFSIGGSTKWYAGGGGGSTQSGGVGGLGGAGGGGSGSPATKNIHGEHGQWHTGGGGGAGGYGAPNHTADNYTGNGGNGGSGVVIVRYKDNSPTPVVQKYTRAGASTINWHCPPNVNSVEVLVVAGGGGGGSDRAGGGGAGGVIYNRAYPVSPGSTYSVTVGAGGTGGQGDQIVGNNGSNSTFGAITATGGGGGAEQGAGTVGRNGGSGGGGYGTDSVTSSGGNGVQGQGFSGGTGGTGGNTKSSPAGASGGGGGAFGPGGWGDNGIAGDGGPGLACTITGSLEFFGGGGGGGVDSRGAWHEGKGGLGGGGDGGYADGRGNTEGKKAEHAKANTGGGGGGGGLDPTVSTSDYGGDGGSGVVIVKWYPQ